LNTKRIGWHWRWRCKSIELALLIYTRNERFTHQSAELYRQASLGETALRWLRHSAILLLATYIMT
jgi:hypothetical protein